ncbi:MAG: hypothetical protein K9J79_03875 [Desulfobacteraceae bacterium]|nr:hypothetical protein [Desulfobacteraceae bacterium]
MTPKPKLRSHIYATLFPAERLAYYFGDKIRYCHAWKTWFIWDGCRWCPDETNRIREFAKETVRYIYKETEGIDYDSKRQAI